MKQHHFNRSKLALLMSYSDFEHLEKVYLSYHSNKYPMVTIDKIVPLEQRLKSNSPANQLTNAIVKYLLWTDNFAERINTMGVYRNGKWTKGTGTPGSADISAIIKGITVKIEVKYGRDKQSEVQKKYQADVERVGAKYWIVKTFTDFLTKYKTL